MTKIKIVPATPELSGEDAKNIIIDANKKPSEESIMKNKMLYSILKNVKNKEDNI